MTYLKDVLGLDGSALQGKRLALGMTGSIACIEAPRLCRSLMRQGADVWVVMSRAATRLIHPDVMEWCSGNPVTTRLSGRVEHIWLAGDSDHRCHAVLLAPATANSLSKLALGIDDTPVLSLLSTAIGSGLPVIVAPGMHAPMLSHPAVQDNLTRLQAMGVTLLWPSIAEHKAKMAPVSDIVESVVQRCTPQTLAGRRVLITAGPTFETIDPIRCIGNRSSGRMGVALAREARRRGATVTLVYGPGTADPPTGVEVRRVETAADMHTQVLDVVPAADIAIFAAAVADYTVAMPSAHKLPTSDGELTLRLIPTPKMIDAARAMNPHAFFVGFKAETTGVEALIATARHRLDSSRLQLVIANQQDNFGSSGGMVHVVDSKTSQVVGPAPKDVLAVGIWDHIVDRVSSIAR